MVQQCSALCLAPGFTQLNKRNGCMDSIKRNTAQNVGMNHSKRVFMPAIGFHEKKWSL